MGDEGYQESGGRVNSQTGVADDGNSTGVETQ